MLVNKMTRNWPTGGCVLYIKLRSIHPFKDLNKGCVLYTGASYTRKNTVFIYKWHTFSEFEYSHCKHAPDTSGLDHFTNRLKYT